MSTALKNKRIAIVGAGVAGLVTAYRLRQQGAEVRLFERNDYVGGRTRSVRKGDFTFDCGALVMLPTYKNVYGLIKELGIVEHIHETKPRLAIIRDGQRHSFDYAHPYRSALSLGLLSWPSKLKLLKVVPTLMKNWSRFHYRSMGDLAPLDTESTHDYCLRVLNQEIDDYLANPFIRINSLTDTHTAPAGEWLWQLAAYRSPHIFQLDRGMVFFAESLAKGMDIHLNTLVTKVQREDEAARVFIAGGDPAGERYDACVLAVPPPFARELTDDVSPAQAEYYRGLESVQLVSLHLGLDFRPDIADSIIMFPEKESDVILDILLDHNKGPGRAPEGKSAVAVQTTLAWSRDHANASDAEIIEALLHQLEPYLGKLEGHIEVSHVNRWEYVCPVTYPGYYRKLNDFLNTRDVDQPLFFCGDFYSGGIEGATTSALMTAEHVQAFLS